MSEEQLEDKKYSVTKLSKITGNRMKASRHHTNPIKGPNSAHAMADAQHGWTHHKYHYASEVELTEADYLAALEAAGQLEIHAPALAPNRK